MMMTHAQSPDQSRVGPEWKDACCTLAFRLATQSSWRRHPKR